MRPRSPLKHALVMLVAAALFAADSQAVAAQPSVIATIPMGPGGDGPWGD